MWPWASIRPGIGESVRPIDHARERPAKAIDLGLVPTAAIAPSRTARASAQGLAGSPVQIRLTLTISSAGPSCCSRSARPGSLAFRFGHHLELAVGDRRAAVDEQMFEPGGVPRRLVERRRVAERRRVEDDDVGDRTGSQDAPIGQAQDLGGQARARADRLLERDDLVVEGVADLARKGAVGAGVGLVAAAGEVGRAVGRGGDELVPHHLADVVLAHAEADRLRAAVPLDLEDDLERRRSLAAGDRDQVEPGPVGSRCVPRDPDRGRRRRARRAAARSRPQSLRPRSGSAASRAKSAVVPCRPSAGHHRRQLGARGDVRILVGRDRLTGRACRGDPAQSAAPTVPQ